MTAYTEVSLPNRSPRPLEYDLSREISLRRGKVLRGMGKRVLSGVAYSCHYSALDRDTKVGVVIK